MYHEVWVTFNHKTSTDDNPKHDRCPPGSESWCKYRQAEAAGDPLSFKHPPLLTGKVQEIIRPIYEELTSMDLLERRRVFNSE